MRVAGLIRVSTSRQAEEGLSQPEQERRIRAYAESQGWDLTELYVEGQSGRGDKWAGRKELDRLLGRLPELDAVIVPKLDRLGRSARHLYETFARFEEHGVRLISLRESIDSSTPAGRMLRGILATMAEFESDQISERVQAVSVAKAKQGRWHGGPRPYGFLIEDGGLKPHPEEGPIVRRIFVEFVRGRTLRAIARDLNQEGIKGTKGGRWSQGRVADRLDNPFYAGFVHLHGELYPGNHEPLIDLDTWNTAQELRRAMQTEYGGRGRRPSRHLFKRGMLKCGICGHAMYPRAQPNYEVYRCSGRDDRVTDCDMPPLRRADVDTAVFDYFRHTALDPEASLAEYDSERIRRLADASAARSAARASLVRITDRRARIKEFMQDGQLAPDEWREQDSALAQAEANAQQGLDEAIASVELLEAAEQPSIFEEWQAIRAAVAGDVGAAQNIEAARAALARVFIYFIVGPVRNFDSELDVGTPRFADVSGEVWVLWPEVRAGAAKVPLVPICPSQPSGDGDPEGLNGRNGLPIRTFGPIYVGDSRASRSSSRSPRRAASSARFRSR